MEILKMGKIPKQNKIICHLCKTEFLYEQEDIHTEKNKRIESNMFSGEIWDDYIKTLDSYIECPLCRHHFVIKSKIESIDRLPFNEMFDGKIIAFRRRIGWND